MDRVLQPFQILAGGYQIVFKGGQWNQVFGAAEKKRSFATEDRLRYGVSGESGGAVLI